MGISIRIPGASFSKFVDREAPYLELASGFWLFGKDKATSQINLAPNAPAGTPSWAGSGTPVFGDGYADMSHGGATSSALDTGITPSGVGDFTYIAVAAPSTTNNEMIMGTWHSGTNATLLYRTSGGQLAVGTGGGASASTISAPPAELAFMAATRDGTNRSVFRHDGSSLQSQVFAAGNDSTPNTYRIGPVGGTGLSSSTNLSRHAANMLFPMALTETQLQDIYSYLKWKLGTRGVSIV